MDWQFELLYQILGGVSGTILFLYLLFYISIKISYKFCIYSGYLLHYKHTQVYFITIIYRRAS